MKEFSINEILIIVDATLWNLKRDTGGEAFQDAKRTLNRFLNELLRYCGLDKSFELKIGDKYYDSI